MSEVTTSRRVEHLRVMHDSLIASLITTGSLVRAIDLASLDKPVLELPEPIAPYRYVDLPSTVIRELWEGERDRRSIKRLSIGVLGLALRLDTPRYSWNYKAIQCLGNNGISYDRLRDCMVYAATLGMRRKLFSRPQYGKAYKASR